MPHVPNCNILSILSISKRNSGKRQVYYFVIISIQWYRTDEFQRKRKPRIIVYSSVTRYGSRASCQRKGLKSNVLQSSLSGSELYPFIFKLPRSSNLRRNKGGMARAGATTKRFPITGGRGPEAEFFLFTEIRDTAFRSLSIVSLADLRLCSDARNAGNIVVPV